MDCCLLCRLSPKPSVESACSGDNVKLCYLVGALLDCMTVGPLAIVILFAMLQDRRRPLWFVAVMFAPPVIIMALCVAYHSDALMPIFYSYVILLIIGLIIYVVCAVRQYGRWLRDNYSDLEHKEVWQSFVVLAAISLALGLYTFDIAGLAYEFAIQMLDIILTCYLLWRVETLSDLSISSDDANEGTVAMAHVEDDDHSLSMRNNIGPLLKPAIRHIPYGTCQADWHQPRISQPALCHAGYHL